MQKLLIFAFVLLLIPILFTSTTFAAKKFVPKKSEARYTATGGIPAIVKYMPNRLGINLSFSNFKGLESVSYSFTYNTNGMAQGAGGKVTAANNPTAARELLFGTCSRGACRYHYNLSGARLTLTARYTNGRTVSKSYRIKTYQ